MALTLSAEEFALLRKALVSALAVPFVAAVALIWKPFSLLSEGFDFVDDLIVEKILSFAAWYDDTRDKLGRLYAAKKEAK